MLAVVDANYKFIWADVRANSATSDCAVFNRSTMRAVIEAETIGFPPQEPLPHDNEDTPFFIVGNDAFPLQTKLMKRFSKCNMVIDEGIYNYRLSRSRRIGQNAFGTLANRFWVFLGIACVCGCVLYEGKTVNESQLSSTTGQLV